jgi:hypothetical protein
MAAGKLLGAMLLGFVMFHSPSALAINSIYGLVWAMGSCKFEGSTADTTTVSFTTWFTSWDNPAGYLRSRAFVLYGYRADGSKFPVDPASVTVVMTSPGGAEAIGYRRGDYSIFYREGVYGWTIDRSAELTVRIVAKNKDFTQWPGIFVRGANRGQFGTATTEMANSVGMYLPLNDRQKCIDNVKPPDPPPPLDVQVSMTTPDWNLGDLEIGDKEKSLPKPADQLCMKYDGAALKDQNFVINASNLNGTANGFYRLKHADDTSQLIPYKLKLDNGNTTVTLPNNGTDLKFSSTGQTCLSPTFRTVVDRNQKPGDYSDVLTFTVVTKS